MAFCSRLYIYMQYSVHRAVFLQIQLSGGAGDIAPASPVSDVVVLSSPEHGSQSPTEHNSHSPNVPITAEEDEEEHTHVVLHQRVSPLLEDDENNDTSYLQSLKFGKLLFKKQTFNTVEPLIKNPSRKGPPPNKERSSGRLSYSSS